MAMPFSRFDRPGSVDNEDRWPLVPATLTHCSVEQLGELMAGEIEAFLAGRLVEHRLTMGRRVPAWVVLNRLAHAAFEDLIELARSGGEVMGAVRDGQEPGWRRGQRALAANLVAGASTPDDVADAQWEVLVPLELSLVERSKSDTVTSRRVLEIAARALADYRRDG
ncbi:MAG TPA: hypothetical protein VFI47_11350 [Acidimicrobiales bacterium]|nr:hypothetical protein [Acidimicrobiales bacterium]